MNTTELAVSQLKTAIRLFNEDDYPAAATLAGAADEILGNIIRSDETDRVSALEENVRYIRERTKKYPIDISDKKIISLLNEPRNSLKHLKFNESQEVPFSLKDAAIDLIDRAVLNHIRVTGQYPVGNDFHQYYTSNRKA